MAGPVEVLSTLTDKETGMVQTDIVRTVDAHLPSRAHASPSQIVPVEAAPAAPESHKKPPLNLPPAGVLGVPQQSVEVPAIAIPHDLLIRLTVQCRDVNSEGPFCDSIMDIMIEIERILERQLLGSLAERYGPVHIVKSIKPLAHNVKNVSDVLKNARSNTDPLELMKILEEQKRAGQM
ncbi:hypothetical protein M427DRAFT_239134 [Gonapodya prolifera JEL478]|uniref:Uncharacterized protein n=1 Tax=Gonapodya prolifera (strain JEL478) TaxID=1344416 RepID=A0A138ZYT0_GONPJ|nr:hypothetical protein M427DRAFT_239134 [Gonapodya prolifera JEL478]|eukprot:KXS09283.1 hypothetical protein M427DRAFT_239134 [Gonapodya prolifera JEL478]